MRLKTNYVDFTEVKAHFKSALQDDDSAFTLKLNQLLLTSRTLENHVKKIQECKEFFAKKYSNNTDMLKASTLKAHFKFMQKRHFIIENKNECYRISDYKKAQNIDIVA